MRLRYKALICGAALVVAVGVLHAYLLDGVDGWVFSKLMGDDTAYAPRFSDAAFRKIQRGMSESDARALLGPPLREVWVYREHAISLPTIEFSNGRVISAEPGPMSQLRTVKVGMTPPQVVATVGAPEEISLVYSTTRHDRSYRRRTVSLKSGRVASMTAEFYVD